MRRRLERHTRCLRSALAQPTRSKLPSSKKHEQHTRCLRSALAQPTRSTLPSSNEHEQLRGHRDAKVVVAARKVVEINT